MSIAREFVDEVTRMRNEIDDLNEQLCNAHVRCADATRDHLLTTEKLREYKMRLWAAARGCKGSILQIPLIDLELVEPDKMTLVEWKDEQTQRHCIRADVKGRE